MNENLGSDDCVVAGNAEGAMSALFASMVVQQTNMALMLLGKVPHPETGETVRDVDAAKLFIDQLEMLEVKTKGNLNKREQDLLKQSLMALRMSFVEAIDASDRPSSAARPTSSSPKSAEDQPPPANTATSADTDAESRKKFSKKY
ncbi:MAG: DUF1844 domain-containing protein [Verrucomicrobia bacterium]|nr:DUF1844 domain-containing protein [Verrucomicrobiota bacterium]